jgi:hypothetical protein
MCSFSLWMLALTGPNSTTSGQISAMKRASEVPPVVESSGVRPVWLRSRATPRRRGGRAA